MAKFCRISETKGKGVKGYELKTSLLHAFVRLGEYQVLADVLVLQLQGFEEGSTREILEFDSYHKTGLKTFYKVFWPSMQIE